MIKKQYPYLLYLLGDRWEETPALILSDGDDTGERLVFGITSQYEGKPEKVRTGRLPIHDWREAGIDKPSYVQLEIIEIAESNIDICQLVSCLKEM